MKKAAKRTVSIVLAMVLVFGLAASAAALSTTATGITLSQSNAIIYIRSGVSQNFVLTASVQPADFTGKIHWDYSNSDVITLRASNSNSITVEGVREGEATITASVESANGRTVSAQCRVSVVIDPVQERRPEKSTYYISPGGTAQVNLFTRYQSGYEEKTEHNVTYSMDNSGLPVATVDSAGLISGIREGSTYLRVYVDNHSLTSVQIIVREITSVTVSPMTMTMNAGESETLSVSVTPAEIQDFDFNWNVDNSSVVSFDSTSKRVTALRPGTATITASVPGNGAISASCIVTVTNPTANFSQSVTLDRTLNFTQLHKEITQKFAEVGGDSLNARLRFTTVGNANYGSVYLSENSSQRADNGYEGQLTSLPSMVFVPFAEGNYEIKYTVSDNRIGLTGTISIQVTVVKKSVTFSVYANSGYSFSESARENQTAVTLLSRAVGPYGSIVFGSVSAGASVGTLYLDESQSKNRLVGSGTVVNSMDVPYLYFVPNRDGVYQINYTAYSGKDGSGNSVAGGLLSIQVGEGTLGLTVNLDSSDPYLFSSTTTRSADSAANLLVLAINETLGSASWEYVRFSLPTSGSGSVGDLYESAASTYSITPETYVHVSALPSLYFRPQRSGNFEITYSVYSSKTDAAPITSGTLRIVVPSVNLNNVNMWYSVAVGGTVTLRDSDFVQFYREKQGNRYQLSHVVFNDYDSDYGAFYYDGAQFRPYNSADYYMSDVVPSTGSNSARYLSRVTFAAENTVGYQVVRFTCYGNEPGQRSYVQQSGILYIFVTAGDVTGIRLPVAGQNAVSLTEDSFVSVYRDAMKDSVGRTPFYIQFLSVPSTGALYYGYRNAGNTGVRLTVFNKNSYKFYANYSRTGNDNSYSYNGSTYYTSSSGNNSAVFNLIGDLTYVPSTTYRGVETVPYMAYSTNGKELFSGVIRFDYGENKTYTVSSEGYMFSASSFSSSGNQTAIRYVTFRQPSSGKLYVNYSNGRGTSVTSTDRFYVSSSADGKYPLTSLCFIPKAGYTGEAELECTVVPNTGSSYDQTLHFVLKRKTSSDTFMDVTSQNGGTWSADAIDFAARWGLVNGVTVTGAKEFAPNRTMRRCDLVLILYRNAGSPTVSGSMPYSDVPADAYYYASAMWAARNSIMDGVITGDRYLPDGEITRQDFVTILYNFTKYMGISTSAETNLNAYRDLSSVSSYAVRPMSWAVNKGYVTSTSTEELLLSPTKTATRAEIATLFHRYLTY